MIAPQLQTAIDKMGSALALSHDGGVVIDTELELVCIYGVCFTLDMNAAPATFY
jgi:hypothetical protein